MLVSRPLVRTCKTCRRDNQRKTDATALHDLHHRVHKPGRGGSIRGAPAGCDLVEL